MLLKADRIAALLDQGGRQESEDPLVITPTPDLTSLSSSGAASVDLRLGTWFVSLRQARMTHLQIGEHESTQQFTKSHYVPFGSKFVLHPGAFVLGVTLEWIRMRRDLAAYVIGKSSWGRRGLVIATATGVHPGFRGSLTLELSNLGEIPTEIKPGMSICQLFIHSVDTGDAPYVDQSQFLGLRKPSLGKLQPDPIAAKLASAAKSGS